MSDRFAQGMAIVEALATEYDIPAHELRWFASNHLAETWPEGHGISSSDTNHYLVSLAHSQPELLREEAERIRDRNKLVARVAESTGKTPEQTLADLRALFAPIDDDPR